MKNKSSFKCLNCAEIYSKWQGQCNSCGEWNTIEEFSTAEVKAASPSKLVKLNSVEKNSLQRISTKFEEVDRVLGMSDKMSGLAQGSVTLVSGDPGIGKSTLLLQVCANLSSSNKGVVYASAEESVNQIALRAKRTGLDKDLADVDFIHDYDVDSIISSLVESNAKFVVIDSIQTVMTTDVSGLPGGMAQVKSSTSRLVNFAKKNGITMFIIGHINKDGNIAGPKILEHLVDTVLHIEGDKKTELRIVKSLKNRFGATNEVGILKMGELGLEDVSNPSIYFLSNDSLPGVARSAVLEGNRTLIVEVQALISSSIYSMPKRVAEGISLSRLQMICAIVQKYTKVNLSDKDVYVNIAGGLKVNDRGLDLAIALAIISSHKSISLKNESVYIGELALTGMVNSSFGEVSKIKEVERLGYSAITSNDLKSISKVNSLLNGL